MPLLSDAQKLFVGGTSINKVFANGLAVWPKGNPDRCVPNFRNFYAAGSIGTKVEKRDAAKYSPYPRRNADHLIEVFFWAPKCIDDPDAGYCSPLYRFIGNVNDPCIGYEPGENWRGGSMLLHYVNPKEYSLAPSLTSHYQTSMHRGKDISFSTNIKAERYGSTERIYRGVPMWWYRLFAFKCAPDPVIACEYSDAIAMCTRSGNEPVYAQTGPELFQVRMYYKGTEPQVYNEQRSNFTFDNKYWGNGTYRPPDYGYPTNP